MALLLQHRHLVYPALLQSPALLHTTRAYDCLTFRESLRTGISYSPICLEEPSGELILLEGLVPSDILEKLRSMAPGI